MDISSLIPELVPGWPEGTDKTIGDKSAKYEIFKAEKETKDLNLPAGVFTFKAQAAGSVTIKLFNDDLDPKGDDKVFNHWDEAKKEIYDKGDGILSYSLKGMVKGSGNVQLKQFELGIDATQSLEVIAYRKHAGNQMISDAGLKDLQSFLHIFDAGEVGNLKPGDALAMQVAGKLEMKASVKISDAFTGSIPLIFAALNLNNKFNLKIDASLSVGATACIEDDFGVYVICLANDKYRVVISKIVKNSIGVDAKAGIEAAINDDDDFKKSVDAIFTGIDDKVFEPINTALTNNQWVNTILPYVQKAAKLLGWDQDISLDAFREKYQELQKTAKKELIKILQTKVSVGISYEYRRIKTSEALLKGEFTKSAVAKYHKQIISLKIGEILNDWLVAPTASKPFNLIEYFKRVTVEVSNSFGISMALGNFHLSSQTLNKLKTETEDVIKGEALLTKVSTYNREMSRIFTMGKDSATRSLRLAADMRNYVNDAALLTVEKFDFDFGFSVEIVDQKLKKSKKELYDVIDWAVTWDIIPQTRFQEVFDTVINDIYSIDSRGIKYKLFFNVVRDKNDDDTCFTKIRRLFPALDSRTLAAAVAAALPYAEVSGRKTMQDRVETYQWFWTDYFQSLWREQKKDPDAFIQTIKDAMEDHFTKNRRDDMLNYEARRDGGSYGDYAETSVRELLRVYNAGVDLDQMKGAFGDLNQDITAWAPYSRALGTFSKHFRNVNFGNYFVLRFIGRILLDLAKDNGMGDEVERGLQITYQDKDNKDKVFIVA